MDYFNYGALCKTGDFKLQLGVKTWDQNVHVSETRLCVYIGGVLNLVTALIEYYIEV